jgi:hypothetical protein
VLESNKKQWQRGKRFAANHSPPQKTLYVTNPETEPRSLSFFGGDEEDRLRAAVSGTQSDYSRKHARLCSMSAAEGFS